MAEPIPGNLLDLATQTVPEEYDLANWTTTAGVAEWFGGEALVVPEGVPGIIGVTSDGAGDTVLTMVNPVPVTSGAIYRGYGYVAYEGRTATITAEIHWYNDSDAEVGDPATLDWTVEPDPDQGNIAIFQAFVTGKAPAGATAARLTFRASHDAAGEYTFYDEFYLGPPPNPSRNLLDYDEYSMETTAEVWQSDAATVGRTRLTLSSGGQTISDGAYMLTLTPESTGIFRAETERLIPVEAGKTYGIRGLFAIIGNGDMNASMRVRPRLSWYDANGNTLTDDREEPFAEYTTGSANQVVAGGISVRTREAPQGAVFARAIIEIDHTPNTSAEQYLADVVEVYETSPEYSVSVSDELGFVSLTIDTAPPWVDPSDPSTFGTYSVHRVEESGDLAPVRGYGADIVNVPFPGNDEIHIEDYEAPIGTRVYYRIVWTPPGGGTPTQLYTRTVQAPKITDGSYVWLKSPGLPALNRKVLMATNPSWKLASRSAMYQIVGRARPVVVSEVRASRAGQIQIRIWDADDNEAFMDLISSGLPVLLQAAPGHGLDGNLYLDIGDASYEPESWNATVPGWLWTLDVTEIDRPEGGIAGSAGRSWEDVLTDHQTWDEVLDTYATWADVLTGG